MSDQIEGCLKLKSRFQRKKGFHAKYLSICKTDIIQPANELKPKNATEIHVLDFFGDRLRARDWIAMINALSTDFTLKFLKIGIRKNNGFILENIDSLRKVKNLTDHPVILTKYVFDLFIDGLQKFLRTNDVLEELALEGLPLIDRYMPSFVNALRLNNSITKLSLSRSYIGDKGCEILCSSIKYLPNIETINLSYCDLGLKGAESIMEYIKLQRIHRFSCAWAASLRYQDGNCITGGLRKIILNNNPLIGDDGLKIITNELREDTWITSIEVRNCGLTEISAENIMNCLAYNKTIKKFDVNNNPKMPGHYVRQIYMLLNAIDSKSVSSMCTNSSSDSCISENHFTREKLLERVRWLEISLELETSRRKQMEELIEQMDKSNKEIVAKLNQESAKIRLPMGYMLIENRMFEEILSEKAEELKPAVILNIRRQNRKILREKKMRAMRKAKIIKLRSIENSIIATASDKIERATSSTQTPVHWRSFVHSPNKAIKTESPYIETNIGDYFHNKESSPIANDDLEINDKIISVLFSKIQN